MRQFKLYNSAGQSYDLNDRGSFFHDPKGLGCENDADYERIGCQFLRTETGMKQPEPEGKIRFCDYDSYHAFAKFLQKSPLKLEYTAAETYYMDVEIKKLKKTELETLGLIIEIEFSGLGPWYLDVVKYLETSSIPGKEYAYTYPYVYKDSSRGTTRIESDSEIESPVQITVIGPAHNLIYTHYVNGVVVASGKILYDLPIGSRMQISSKIPYTIQEIDSTGNTKDLYQYSDFSTERFLWIHRGTNEIFFSHEGSEDLQVAVEAMIYYDTI